MRYIALILAPAIVLSALAAAGATEAVAPSPIKIAVFPFELENFSAAAAYRHRSRPFWSAIEIQTETLLVRPRALSFPSGSSYYNALQFSSGFFFSDALDHSHFPG